MSKGRYNGANALMKYVLTVLALLSLLLVSGPALAEDGTGYISAKVELYQEGYLPTPIRATVVVTPRGLMDFDEYIAFEMLRMNASINVSDYGIQISDINSMIQDTINHHPELFFISKISYSYNPSSELVTSVNVTYKYSAQQLSSMMTAFNAELNRIVAYASKATTPLGKALLVNDYFCVNYQYDLSYEIYDAFNLFTQKTGVCQAYMLGYMAAMNKLGIPCEIATSQDMNHTWNLINIDGQWYHVDVTWNDPIQDRAYRARHQYFMCSDAGIDDHYGWVAPVTASNTSYDSFFWESVDTPIPVSGDSMYYIDEGSNSSTRYIISWTVGTSAFPQLHSFDARWYVFGNPYSYWSSYYGLLGLHEGRLVYATPTEVYSVALDGGDRRLVFMPDTTAGYIYGGCVWDGLLLYGISASPNDSVTPYSHTLGGFAPTVISLDMTELMLEPGESCQLKATTDIAGAGVIWHSSNEAAATVSGGVVTAVSPGSAVITASCADNPAVSAACSVTVKIMKRVTLPGDLTAIEGEAFMGGDMERVEAGDGLLSIGARAFANCENLRVIRLGRYVSYIAEDAFAGCESLAFICPENSYAAEYAARKGFAVRTAAR